MVNAVNFGNKCCESGECGEKENILPHFTAFLTNIHRKIHRISSKNSPHRLSWQNNVRNAVKAVNAVKKITTFHRISYKN